MLSTGALLHRTVTPLRTPVHDLDLVLLVLVLALGHPLHLFFVPPLLRPRYVPADLAPFGRRDPGRARHGTRAPGHNSPA